MSNFIVRVELSVESHNRYTWIRDHLLAIGFTKRVTGSDGREYRLPTGNYRIESNADKMEILTAVQKIALAIDKAPLILVCDVKEKGMAWYGLQVC